MPSESMFRLGLRLTPHGRLVAEHHDDAPACNHRTAARLAEAFAEGSGQGLLQLGAGEVGQLLPPAFVWWRAFAARYVTALCLNGPAADNDDALPKVPSPDAAERAALTLTAPMMPGAEYLTPDVLQALWEETAAACAAALAAAQTDLQSFLRGLNPAWNLVGRVHFNLAENRHDAEAPFAFMATYTTRLSAQAKAQHVPLGQAVAAAASATRRRRVRVAEGNG